MKTYVVALSIVVARPDRGRTYEVPLPYLLTPQYSLRLRLLHPLNVCALSIYGVVSYPECLTFTAFDQRSKIYIYSTVYTALLYTALLAGSRSWCCRRIVKVETFRCRLDRLPYPLVNTKYGEILCVRSPATVQQYYSTVVQ